MISLTDNDSVLQIKQSVYVIYYRSHLCLIIMGYDEMTLLDLDTCKHLSEAHLCFNYVAFYFFN